jgi:threonine/homoserine/homoserine lactone efflux protein
MSGHLISSGALVKLLLDAALVMGTPGPSTIAVMASGAAFGISRSLPFMLGAIAGTTVVLAGVAAGVTTLLLSLPATATVLTVGGLLYVLYLAWRIATAPPLSRQADLAAAPTFTGGFVLAVGNPKAWLAIAAVFTGTVLTVSSTALDGTLKALLLAAMIVAIHVVWLFGGAYLASLLRDPLWSRIANLLFAAILAGTAVLALLR